MTTCPPPRICLQPPAPAPAAPSLLLPTRPSPQACRGPWSECPQTSSAPHHSSAHVKQQWQLFREEGLRRALTPTARQHVFTAHLGHPKLLCPVSLAWTQMVACRQTVHYAVFCAVQQSTSSCHRPPNQCHQPPHNHLQVVVRLGQQGLHVGRVWKQLQDTGIQSRVTRASNSMQPGVEFGGRLCV